ncbi:MULTISPECIES: cystathionine beta-lyase [Pseudomonas putida group]|uniref:cystathionine beta-lyase n=1 Tax=Pseudomonas putida group TaxID=136845 RepID=UPI0009B8BA70|nr:cystathionine beta-lyase [Pseudomonas putida]
MNSMNSKLGVSTQLTRSGRDHDLQLGFVNMPVYRGSTVVFKTLDDFENARAKFAYGTLGTPTIQALEDAWTQLSGAAGTVISPSGLGALALAFFTTIKSGDHILIPDTAYRPTRQLCDSLIEKFGIEVNYYDPLIGEGISDLIKSNTSTILLESPGSQTFEIQDVPAIVGVAKQAGVKTILDNTWATPLFFRAHDHGCDISVEAGTKYLGGHSDLLMGLVTANEVTWPLLRKTYDAIAMLPGPEDCFLALRGLRTLHLRVHEAQKRGLELARWLSQQPEVETVLHPALESCPGHDLWKRDFLGSTGVFSIVLKKVYTNEALALMLDNLCIFGMGYSWGGFESLITPFDCSPYRTVTSRIPKGTALRLQIGLEDMEDLKDDLKAALGRLHN